MPLLLERGDEIDVIINIIAYIVVVMVSKSSRERAQ